MGLRIPPIEIKIMLESNPLKPIMLVGRLGVGSGFGQSNALSWASTEGAVGTSVRARESPHDFYSIV